MAEQSKDDVSKEESSPNVFKYFMKLPELVQAHVLAHCSFGTLMNITQTCKQLNDLVFSDLPLAKRIKLKLGSLNMPDDAMEILQASDRRYRVIHISSFKYKAKKIMKFLELKGWFIRELKIGKLSELLVDEDPDNIDLVVQVLISCKNLEKLSINLVNYLEIYENGIHDETLVSLPKLRSLKTTLSMLVGILNKVHLDVHGLVKLFVDDYYDEITENFSVDQLEEFILQQHNLKSLKIYVILPRDSRGLFPEHRLKDVKFRLESFDARYFLFDSCESAEKFFKMQRSSLKKARFIDFFKKEHVRLVDEIFSLPQLKCLTVKNLDEYLMPNKYPYIIDITHRLSNIANQSIEYIVCDYHIHDITGLIASHPNLKMLKLDPIYNTFTINFPTEILKIIEVDPCTQIDYKPVIPPSDPQKAADDLLEFFSRHQNRKTRYDDISCVKIGDASWIDNDLSLPLSFWENVFLIFEDIKDFTFTAYINSRYH